MGSYCNGKHNGFYFIKKVNFLFVLCETFNQNKRISVMEYQSLEIEFIIKKSSKLKPGPTDRDSIVCTKG